MSNNNLYETPEGSYNPEHFEVATPNFFSLSERIGRARYFAYSMMHNLIFLFLFMIFGIFMGLMDAQSIQSGNEISPGIWALFGLMYLLLIVAGCSLMVRRLHDLDKTGWMALLFLVPFINIIFIFYIIFTPGTAGPNNYGPPPAPNTVLTWIGGLLIPIVFCVGILAAIAIPAYQAYVLASQNLSEQVEK